MLWYRLHLQGSSYHQAHLTNFAVCACCGILPHNAYRIFEALRDRQCSVTHFLPTFQRSLSSKETRPMPKRRTKVTMKPSLPSVCLPMLPTSAHGKGLGWSTYSGQPMVGSPAKHSTGLVGEVS